MTYFIAFRWSPEENAARGGGKLKCWGDNSMGQLGQVSAGFTHACALVLVDGTKQTKLVCWGENSAGQLFLNPNADDFSWIGDDPGEMGAGMTPGALAAAADDDVVVAVDDVDVVAVAVVAAVFVAGAVLVEVVHVYVSVRLY
ncbi:hypothetical protein T492DRAFT_465364 [Pavlovales sp. CCMP2436]|nr:hypothetical protein T492DRAFT_465364 [Pavlovales sp. CCMP2436]